MLIFCFRMTLRKKNAIGQRIIDETKWMVLPSWKLSDNEDNHEVLGGKVLDIWGHGAGLSVAEFPEEFDYYADFKLSLIHISEPTRPY